MSFVGEAAAGTVAVGDISATGLGGTSVSPSSIDTSACPFGSKAALGGSAATGGGGGGEVDGRRCRFFNGALEDITLPSTFTFPFLCFEDDLVDGSSSAGSEGLGVFDVLDELSIDMDFRRRFASSPREWSDVDESFDKEGDGTLAADFVL